MNIDRNGDEKMKVIKAENQVEGGKVALRFWRKMVLELKH